MMKSLFRGFEERRREEIIKSNLMQELKKTVKELMTEHQEEGVLRSVDVSNTLCTTLESIFIHGLKETLVSKFSSVMAGPDQVPEPEFWSLILVFSHRDIIQQIQKFSQITTDIGRSRAWIRLVLNDSMLPSYIESIAGQNSALAPYYKKTALLRDAQILPSLQEQVNTISNIVFDFPTNSCLLNYWPTPPLLMAGLWTPPIKLSAPPTDRMEEATDLAAEMADDYDQVQQPNLYVPSLEQPVLYDESEALKIILGTPVQDTLLKHFEESKESKSVETAETSTQIDINNDLTLMEKAVSSKAVAVEIQTDTTDEKTDQFHSVEKEEDIEDEKESERSSSPKERRESINSESYDVLLKNYNPVTSFNTVLPSSPSKHLGNLDSILQTYDLMTDIAKPPDSKSQDEMSASFIIEQERKNMISHLGKLVLESGLISQNFLCKSCSQNIGISFASFKICGLTGQYYCEACFDEKEWVIPARILHNWDFSKHPVSSKAYVFLSEVQAHPLINIRNINPKLYLIVPEMEKLQKQRMKLNLLRMYLTTCREPVIEELKKQLWPREYLYEHIHIYSVSDLLEIPSSSLSQTLSEVIKFCESHVVNCQLCSQKGFICEVCNSQKIIFPFHLDTTYRCLKCGLVLHLECIAQVQDCPKCLRIHKRTN